VSFSGPPEAYDDFMGRYSALLSPQLADLAGVRPGLAVLDVGCGPGALTGLLVERGADVAAAEPEPRYAAACAARHPSADVRNASAEALPWPDDRFDAAIAQLVVHFLADPVAGVREMARVVRPGGVVAACTWDSGGGMVLLEVFWAGVAACGLEPPPERGAQRCGTAGELEDVWRAAGLSEVQVAPLDVESRYADGDRFWAPFTGATGPPGAYLAALAPERQAAVRAACLAELDRRGLVERDGSVRVPARSWAVSGVVGAGRPGGGG
jgi:SAM-dependent methyltransferase